MNFLYCSENFIFFFWSSEVKIYSKRTFLLNFKRKTPEQANYNSQQLPREWGNDGKEASAGVSYRAHKQSHSLEMGLRERSRKLKEPAKAYLGSASM